MNASTSSSSSSPRREILEITTENPTLQRRETWSRNQQAHADLEMNSITEGNEEQSEKKFEISESMSYIFILNYKRSFVLLLSGVAYYACLIWSCVYLLKSCGKKLSKMCCEEDEDQKICNCAFDFQAIPLIVLAVLFGTCIVTEITIKMLKITLLTFEDELEGFLSFRQVKGHHLLFILFLYAVTGIPSAAAVVNLFVCIPACLYLPPSISVNN